MNNIQSSADEGTNDNENLIKALNEFLNSKGGAAPKKEEAKAAEASASAKAEAPAADSRNKWKEMKFNDSQIHVMREALAKGMNVIGLTVYVQESCILKAARAFLVYKTLEDMGEIIVSNPSAQDIEDEKFEYDFSIIVVSEAGADKSIEAAKAVSEIEEVVGGLVEVPGGAAAVAALQDKTFYHDIEVAAINGMKADVMSAMKVFANK